MPLLPLDPPCLIVPVRGCGFTPAPPAGTGKHSQDHMLCSTHLMFLASQLCPLLCFTYSFFPATFCLFTVSPCHTGLLQAFPQWQWLGVLLFWWDSLAATVPGGGTPLLEWDVPHPRACGCALSLRLLPRAHRQQGRGSASCSGRACLGCCRLHTAVWGLAGNGSEQTRAAHIHSHLSIPKLGELVVNI